MRQGQVNGWEPGSVEDSARSLEGDPLELEVVNVLRHEGSWLESYGHVMQDAKQMLSHCLERIVNHVYSQGNGVAHFHHVFGTL